VRLGICTEIGSLAPSQAVEMAVRAEQLGFAGVWTSESGGPDGIAPLAAIAARTRRLRLGTAILPIANRTPVLTAMTAATLQALSAGRFVLGLGLSTRHVVTRWHGQPHDRPLLRLREYVTVVRDLLGGRRVDFAGSTLGVHGFRLRSAPQPTVPVYVAALGPRACRLAGSLADGVIFFLKTPAGVRQAVAWVAEGAAAAGRDPADVEVVLMAPVVGTGDPDAARAYVAGYVRVPEYASSLRYQGLGAAVEAIQAGWADGRDRAAASVPDELLQSLCLPSDRAAAEALLAELANAGVRTVLLLPVGSAGAGATACDLADRVLWAFAPVPAAT